MATVTRTPKAKSNKAATSRKKKSENPNKFDPIIKKIKEAQRRLDNSTVGRIRASIEIGSELKKLQEAAGKQWPKLRKELGYTERKAQRLQQVADGPLADFLRTSGTDLVAQLPVDLQKLCALSRLTVDQIEEALKGDWDCDDMNRKQLSDAVTAMEECASAKEALSTARDTKPAAKVAARKTRGSKSGDQPSHDDPDETAPEQDEVPDEEVIEDEAEESETHAEQLGAYIELFTPELSEGVLEEVETEVISPEECDHLERLLDSHIASMQDLKRDIGLQKPQRYGG